MLKNYIIITVRNLLRHKLFSFINILGLAIGMAAGLLILQYVSFELSYDSFHQNKDRIYRIPVEFYLANGQRDYIESAGPPALGPALKQDFPEVAEYVRLHWLYDGNILSYQNNRFREERMYFAEPSFLTIFSYPLLKGDAQTALNEPNTILLTESAARKYFGNQEAVGKVIQFNGKENLLVTGILQDIPANSHLQFSALISFATLAQKEDINSWGWYNFFTYILLKPEVDANAFASKLPAFLEKHQGHDMRKSNYRSALIFQPLSDVYLNNATSYEVELHGNRQAVYFLSVIALFVMVIAWVNYVNLSTAKATQRAKEVGIRKVIGSTRPQLIGQFLLESVLMNLMAVVIAFFLAYAALPLFQLIVGKYIPFNFSQNPWIAFLSIGVLITGTLASAFYPAVVLSSFKPVRVLKGSKLNSSQGVWLRKGLVVLQFAASVALIIGTLVVYQQLQFMRQQDLGVNVDQMLIVRAPKIRDSTYVMAQSTFKTEMLRNQGVQRAAFSNCIPGEEITDTAGNIRRKGKKGKEGNYSLVWIDYDFIPTYDLQIIAGRNFSQQFSTDKQGVILNETAARTIGFTTPEEAISQIIMVRNQEKTVVGVIKDYHQRSLQNRHEPVVLLGDLSRSVYFSVKVSPANMPQTIATVKSAYENTFPGNPFEYFFLDEYFNRQYQADNQFGQAFGFFAALAIFVACMGLFGLASFTTSQRTKEIGVRKVLGAAVPDIILLLSKDFMLLVLIAFMLAVPVAWYMMHQWLESYAFRTELTWWLFIVPGACILLVSLLTVSLQTWKAALMNPIKSLRNE